MEKEKCKLKLHFQATWSDWLVGWLGAIMTRHDLYDFTVAEQLNAFDTPAAIDTGALN